MQKQFSEQYQHLKKKMIEENTMMQVQNDRLAGLLASTEMNKNNCEGLKKQLAPIL